MQPRAFLNTKERTAFWLWKLGLRTILPAKIINAIPIRETNDPLICLPDGAILLESSVFEGQSAHLRASVCQRLQNAQSYLPSGLCLKLYDAYRSPAAQRAAWAQRYAETQQEFPDENDAEITRRTRLKIADPRYGGFGGHQTGAAVDVTLATQNGTELPMGSAVAAFTPKTATKNKHLTQEERHNRKTLLLAMNKAGFVNFPAEWWHFSYGDRMWAAYSQQPVAFYGQAAPNVL